VSNNDHSLNQLSAFLDGELSPSERDALLEAMARDEELAGAWERYHLIGDAMRNALPEVMGRDISARVHQAVAGEPVILAPRHRRRALARPVLGFALAASVAAVAILGVRQLNREASPGQPLLVAQEQALPANDFDNSAIQPASVQTLPNAQLDSYLVNYYEHQGNMGMLPYVRIISHDPNE